MGCDSVLLEELQRSKVQLLLWKRPRNIIGKEDPRIERGFFIGKQLDLGCGIERSDSLYSTYSCRTSSDYDVSHV